MSELQASNCTVLEEQKSCIDNERKTCRIAEWRSSSGAAALKMYVTVETLVRNVCQFRDESLETLW